MADKQIVSQHWLVEWWVAQELWVLAVATPFFVFPGRWRVLIGVLLIGLSWVARRLVRGRWTRATPLVWPLGWLGVMTFVGYQVSVDPGLSWSKLWGIIGQMAVFWGVVNGLQGERSWQWVRWGYLCLPLVVAVLSFVGTDWSQVRLAYIPIIYDHLPQISLGLPNSGVPRLNGLFHVRQVGATMAILLPLPLAWSVWGTGWERWLAVVATLVASVILLLSQALMGVLGVMVAIWILVVWRWRPAVWAPVVAAVVGVVGLVAYGPGRVALFLLDQGNPVGIAIVLRLDMWSRAWAMLADMPLTGVGLNTYPLIQSHFYLGYLIGPEPHAHNLFLQTAVDLGWPGLIAFFWLIGLFLVEARRAYQQITDEQRRVWLVAAVAGVLVYVVGGILDTMTLGAKPMAAWWGLLALPTALAAMEGSMGGEGAHSEPLQPERRWGRLLWVIPPLLLMVALGLLAGGRNWAAWRGHQAVYTARTTGPAAAQLASAAELLAADWGENVYLWHLRGSVAAWQGEDEAAWAAWQAAAALERERPLAIYAPFLLWLFEWGLVAEAPATTIDSVYHIWQARYPERADYYVLRALWREGNGQTEAAAKMLTTGQAAEAGPAGILQRPE